MASRRPEDPKVLIQLVGNQFVNGWLMVINFANKFPGHIQVCSRPLVVIDSHSLFLGAACPDVAPEASLSRCHGVCLGLDPASENRVVILYNLEDHRLLRLCDVEHLWHFPETS